MRGNRRLRQVVEPGQAFAYEACLESAKKDSKLSKASFASFEESKVAGSTGEEESRVNVPYELDGKKHLFQCIAQKQADGSFKAVF
ncbi:MAG: hypothetical protein GEV13_07670 [Rhodospirillales bacterium]|nr:hypothetical protein [Rhodospirillales bacterium]